MNLLAQAQKNKNSLVIFPHAERKQNIGPISTCWLERGQLFWTVVHSIPFCQLCNYTFSQPTHSHALRSLRERCQVGTGSTKLSLHPAASTSLPKYYIMCQRKHTKGTERNVFEDIKNTSDWFQQLIWTFQRCFLCLKWNLMQFKSVSPNLRLRPILDNIYYHDVCCH